MKNKLILILLIHGLHTINGAEQFTENELNQTKALYNTFDGLVPFDFDSNDLDLSNFEENQTDEQTTKQVEEVIVHLQTPITLITPLNSQNPVALPIDRSIEDLIKEEGMPIIRSNRFDIMLYLQHREITSLIGLNTIKNIHTINNLYLNNNEICKIDVEAFTNLPELYELDLKANQIEYIDIEIFTKLPKLKLLNLSKNRLKIKNVKKIEEYCELHNILSIILMQNPLPPTGQFTKAPLRESENQRPRQILELDQPADEENDATEEENK